MEGLQGIAPRSRDQMGRQDQETALRDRYQPELTCWYRRRLVWLFQALQLLPV